MTVGLPRANPQRLTRPSLKIFLLVILKITPHCRVVGSSMDPTINDGDLIIYSNKNRTYKKGQIVVIKHPNNNNRLIVKRIYNINQKGVDIRGDNKDSSTDSRHFGLINNNLIIGLVEKIISNNR